MIVTREREGARRDPLLEPFTLGGLALRNRIVSTSHEPAYTEAGMPAERYRLYHLEKARGGVGLTMIGGSAVVAPDSPAAFGNIDMTTDEVVPWLRALADGCHAEGAAVMIQLTHLGARSSNFAGEWLPLVSSSRYREPAHRSFAKEAEEFDLDRIVAQFADAAVRAAEAGLDGIELEHYGHLLDSFASPARNEREDDLGGDLERRLAFPLRVIDAIRSRVPRGLALGIRMSVDEGVEGGIDEDEAVRILDAYASHGVDFLSLIKGSISSDAQLAEVIPGMGTPSSPFLDLCRRLRERIDIPVMHSARIGDVSTARHALESGAMDLVGMTRAQLADPYLVRKIEERREDDIRPCVGANACLDGIYASGSAHCIHNPATGREETIPQLVPTQAELPSPGRRPGVAVVVGAGPAGLEAARVLALRGHQVTVFEAADRPGGQIAIAARSERRRDLIGIVDWRYQQARKHGASFRFNTVAEAADVRAMSPSLVIVATGGLPDTVIAPARVPVHDVWDVMTDQLPGHGPVVVYDDHGAYPALDAVERLAGAGRAITYVSPERMIGVDVGSMNSPAYLRAFDKYGVEVLLANRLVGVERRKEGRRGQDDLTVWLRNDYTGTERAIVTSALVSDHGTAPNDELYFDLRGDSLNGGAVDQDAFRKALPQPDPGGEGYRLFRVGDAVTSRNIHAAILDSLRLCIRI